MERTVPRPAVTTTLVIAAVLEALILIAVVGAFGARDAEVVAEGTAPTRSTLDYAAVSALAVVVPFVPVLFASRGWVDGFALGSIVFATIIEAILAIGWLGSPQHEPAWYFWAATLLPAVLIGSTYWFYAIQAKT